MSGALPTLQVFLTEHDLLKYYDGMVAYGADNIADWMAFTEAEFSAAVTSADINMAQGHIIRFAKAVQELKDHGATEQLLPPLLSSLLPAIKEHLTTAATSLHQAGVVSKMSKDTHTDTRMDVDGEGITVDTDTVTRSKSAAAYNAVSSIFQTAMELNEKYKISENIAAGVAAGVTKAKALDEEYKISDKVGEGVKERVAAGIAKAYQLDEKYKISEKVQAKVEELAATGQRQGMANKSTVIIEELNSDEACVHRTTAAE